MLTHVLRPLAVAVWPSNVLVVTVTTFTGTPLNTVKAETPTKFGEPDVRYRGWAADGRCGCAKVKGQLSRAKHAVLGCTEIEFGKLKCASGFYTASHFK